MLHWMHLLPVDRYTVQTNSFITEADQKIITLLYQPLIGSLAHSLYLTLLSELERDQFVSSDATHKTLMTMMGISLDRIYEERKKLEGIGLLVVYKKKQAEDASYLYKLQKPFSPLQFFNDDVLSVYLYNRVGKHRYLQLKERFSLAKEAEEEFHNITYAFNDVFTSLHHSEIASQQEELLAALTIESKRQMIGQHDGDNFYSIMEETFDFSLLSEHLSDLIDSKKLLTEKVKEAIVRLAFVYRIDPYEMSKILQNSLLHDDTVDIERLRENVNKWYKFTFELEPPGLGLRTHPEEHRTMSGNKPRNEEEELIYFYETESPITLLESRSDGARVPLSDMKIVESLLLDYRLLPGVVNVLIDFVLQINDMKLTKSYVEKIAGQWGRKNLKTVTEAMKLAKGEYKKRNQWEQGMTEAATTKEAVEKPNRYVRKDRLPKWLTEEKPVITEKDQKEAVKLKEELELKLQRYKLERNKEG